MPLARILEPYEAELLAGTMFTEYRLECARLTGEQRSDGQGWEREEIGREEIVGRGTVLRCGGRTEPGADVGDWYLLVLDDSGSTTLWGIGTGGWDLPAARPGLLCREYIATPGFERAMQDLGGSAPWNDDVLAYQWALAYWYLDGSPDRMDVDRNGIPCELLFDPDVVAAIWSGDFSSPSPSTTVSSTTTTTEVVDPGVASMEVSMTPSGSEYILGPVHVDFVVTNTGSASLQTVTLHEGSAGYGEGLCERVPIEGPHFDIGNSDGALDPGEQWSYHCDGKNNHGGPDYFVEVSATSPTGQTIIARDEARHSMRIGGPVTVTLTPSAASVSPGEIVEWAIELTNVRDFVLPPLGRVDAAIDPPGVEFPTSFDTLGPAIAKGTDGDDSFEPGETWTWAYSAPITSDGSRLVGSVDFIRHPPDGPTSGWQFESDPITVPDVEPEEERIVVTDTFEQYLAGGYPADGGWYPYWSGESAAVSADRAHHGEHSFRLEGHGSWVRTDVLDLDMSDVEAITYRVAVNCSSENLAGAEVGFLVRTASNESWMFNSWHFKNSHDIYVKGDDLDGDESPARFEYDTGADWEYDIWYVVEARIDYQDPTISFWLDGTQLTTEAGAQLVAAPAELSSAFALANGYDLDGVTYFDDVEIIVTTIVGND